MKRHAKKTPEDFSRAATLQPSSLSAADHTFEMVVSTEEPTRVYDARQDRVIVEVLRSDGVQIPRQTPIVDDHVVDGINSILGSARSWRVDGGSVVAKGHIDAKDPMGLRAWGKIEDGHLTDVSPRYRVMAFRDVPAGKTETVAGRSYTAGPEGLRVTTKWAPKEVSLTPIGANDQAKIRSDAGPEGELKTETSAMKPELRKYLEDCGLRSDASDKDANEFMASLAPEKKRKAEELAAAPDDAELARKAAEESTRKTADAEAARKATAADDAARKANPNLDTIRKESVDAERKRVKELRELAGTDLDAETLRKAIEEGWTLDQTKDAVLTAIRKGRVDPEHAAGSGPAIHSHGFEKDCTVRSLTAGLMHRTMIDCSLGFARKETNGNPQIELPKSKLRMFDGDKFLDTPALDEKDAERGDKFRNLSFFDIAHACCELNGKRIASWNKDEIIRTAVSTTTFSEIFSTNIWAKMEQGYQEIADNTVFCSEEDLTNFQTVERGSLGKTATPRKHARGGTAKHTTMGDTKETFKLFRYSEQFVVDEQDLLDDNLGGFQEVPMEIGNGFARLRPDLVYAIILRNPSLGADSVAVFSAATHVNKDANALSAPNVATGMVAMGNQKLDGVTLNLSPTHAVMPKELWHTGETIFRSPLLITGANATQGGTNVVPSLGIQPIYEPRINATGVFDPDSEATVTGSATNWFLFSTGTRRGLRVFYRSGAGRRPAMRRFALDRGQWGIGWDFNFDIAVGFLDYRPCYQGNV